MKIFNRVLMLFFIVLMIVACFLLVKENKKNIELDNKLVVAEQELLDTQKEVDTLTGNLQTEIDKNKNLEDNNKSMEEMISELNLELSNANEKIAKMEETGVPVYFTEEEVNYIAKTVYGEAGVCSKIQQSAVVWCILNRLDSGYWGNTIKKVVTAPSQFHGYSSDKPVTNDIRELVEDILFRWNMEKAGATNIGRTLPERFLYFHADGTGRRNNFTTKFGGGEVWDFDCWNPYE